jgi:hypothetical protein
MKNLEEGGPNVILQAFGTGTIESSELFVGKRCPGRGLKREAPE